jgi:hypothetical protein
MKPEILFTSAGRKPNHSILIEFLPEKDDSLHFFLYFGIWYVFFQENNDGCMGGLQT